MQHPLPGPLVYERFQSSTTGPYEDLATSSLSRLARIYDAQLLNFLFSYFIRLLPQGQTYKS